LIGTVVLCETTPKGVLANPDARTEGCSRGVGDIADGNGLIIQPAVVDTLDILSGKIAALKNMVYNETIADSLNLWY
jgi:hypothetical protein